MASRSSEPIMEPLRPRRRSRPGIAVTADARRELPAMPTVQSTRVGRSMAAGSPGTVKLCQRYGEKLLLVRYRYDWTGLYRYTTVEIVVDAAPTMRGRARESRYAVHIRPNEHALLAAAKKLGARWDPQLRRWTLTGHAVQTLDLIHRVELAEVPPPRRTLR